MVYLIFTIWSVQITVTEEIIVKMPLKKRSHAHITVIQVLVVLRYLCLRVRTLTRTFWSAHEHYNFFFFVFRVCKKFMIQKEWLKISIWKQLHSKSCEETETCFPSHLKSPLNSVTYRAFPEGLKDRKQNKNAMKSVFYK